MSHFAFRNDLYKLARAHVPAYRRMLASEKVKTAQIKSEEDWQKVPVIEKSSYIKKSTLKDLFPDARIPVLAYASSGSSGSPTFWFRTPEQEKIGKEIHERILRDVFGISKKESVLVISCFSMGIWVAGHYTFASFKRLAEEGNRISIITPALEREDSLRILSELAPQFDAVILAGYPPFLMDVVMEAERRNIALPKNFNILASGDKFTEEWRASIAAHAGIARPEYSIVSVYGSADATVMGHETRASIMIRRVAAAKGNEQFKDELFGADAGIPAIVEYDANHIFFEEIEGELVITANPGAPLIRYNIHDRGAVVSRDAMRAVLEKHGLLERAIREGFDAPAASHMQFLILKGRTDVAVTFYALNLYPEHIQACVDIPSLSSMLTGSYSVYTKMFRKERDEKLFLHLEMKEGRGRAKSGVEKRAARHVLDTLFSVSTEFRRLYSAIGARALPNVKLVPYGALKQPAKARGMLMVKGKKPKVVVS
jgi:phenylacetate-CoA ligase